MGDWHCACCLRRLRSACVTAPCGHGFHTSCHDKLTRGRGGHLECPECQEETCSGDVETWRTFWGASDGATQGTPSLHPAGGGG